MSFLLKFTLLQKFCLCSGSGSAYKYDLILPRGDATCQPTLVNNPEKKKYILIERATKKSNKAKSIHQQLLEDLAMLNLLSYLPFVFGQSG